MKNAHKFSNLSDNPSKTMTERLIETFIEEDPHTAGKNVVDQVVIPRIKSLVTEGAISFISLIFGGSKRVNTTGYRDYTPSGVVRTYSVSTNYNKPQQQAVQTPKRKISIDNMTYDDMGTAEGLMNEINTEIEEKGHISIYEVYELITPSDEPMPVSQHDSTYGWRNKLGHRAEIHLVGSQYRVVLPRPVSLT